MKSVLRSACSAPGFHHPRPFVYAQRRRRGSFGCGEGKDGMARLVLHSFGRKVESERPTQTAMVRPSRINMPPPVPCRPIAGGGGRRVAGGRRLGAAEGWAAGGVCIFGAAGTVVVNRQSMSSHQEKGACRLRHRPATEHRHARAPYNEPLWKPPATGLAMEIFLHHIPSRDQQR